MEYSDGDTVNRGIECWGVWKNRESLPVSHFISKMMQVRAIVTMEGKYEIIPLSNGAIPRIELYLQWKTNRKSYIMCRTVPYSVILNDPYPWFQGHTIIWRWMSQNGMSYRRSFSGKLIGTFICPSQQCHFEWFWVILSDLAKYSMTQSVAQSHCDSWASC